MLPGGAGPKFSWQSLAASSLALATPNGMFPCMTRRPLTQPELEPRLWEMLVQRLPARAYYALLIGSLMGAGALAWWLLGLASC